VNFTKLMYVGLTFSIPEVGFDWDSFGFEVAICGSSAKHNAAPKKQRAKINPFVFIFMKRSNLDGHFSSTFLCCGRIGPSVLIAFRAEVAHLFLLQEIKSCVPALNPASTCPL